MAVFQGTYTLQGGGGGEMEGGREEPFRVERWMLFLPYVLSLSKWASHSFSPNHVIILAEARIKSPSTLLSLMKDGSTSRQMGKCLPNTRTWEPEFSYPEAT